MNIIAGKASQLLAGRVLRELEGNLLMTEFKRFPDGELYTRILDELEGSGEVTIIQSTVNDSDFIALLQLIDICRDASKINVVIPYMGYARQDKAFKRGEPVSARAMAQGIKADNVYTINIHEESILDYFDAHAVNLDAVPEIGRYINNMEFGNPLIVAPDKSALPIARKAAEKLGIGYDFLDKTRLSGESVTISQKNMDVKGRDVIIIDDLISTGGTMTEAISLLREQGAHEVFVACVHPVLSGNAVLRLFQAGVKGIIATDTIDKGVSVVSVAPVIVSVLWSP